MSKRRPAKVTRLVVDRVVRRDFDMATGAEKDPYIEVRFMQDRVDICAGDIVEVAVKVLHRSDRKLRRRNP